MTPSFHTADRQTFRRVAVVGVLFCLAFVAISFSLRPQTEETRALVKADRLTDGRREASRPLTRPSGFGT
jgi:hypothetical protein